MTLWMGRYTNKARSYLVRLPWFNKMRSMVLSGECRYFYCAFVSDTFYVTERLLITNGLQVIRLCRFKRDNANIDETVIDIYGNAAYYIPSLDFIPLPSIFNGFADILFGKLAYPLNDNIHGLIDRVDVVRGVCVDTDYAPLVDDGKFSGEALKAIWGSGMGREEDIFVHYQNTLNINVGRILFCDGGGSFTSVYLSKANERNGNNNVVISVCLMNNVRYLSERDKVLRGNFRYRLPYGEFGDDIVRDALDSLRRVADSGFIRKRFPVIMRNLLRLYNGHNDKDINKMEVGANGSERQG